MLDPDPHYINADPQPWKNVIAHGTVPVPTYLTQIVLVRNMMETEKGEILAPWQAHVPASPDSVRYFRK
jgi:hypothetical protein